VRNWDSHSHTNLGELVELEIRGSPGTIRIARTGVSQAARCLRSLRSFRAQRALQSTPASATEGRELAWWPLITHQEKFWPPLGFPEKRW
jgi:hypothetical protein